MIQRLLHLAFLTLLVLVTVPFVVVLVLVDRATGGAFPPSVAEGDEDDLYYRS